MRIHFIAIGGAAMHNLAIALHKKGYTISGSDDKIFDPSLSRLKRFGILPEKIGWFPEKITHNLDAIILGMHAREDNPELKKAKEIGIKIFSYPEYLYEQTKNKKRIVIAGSHGKTTITAMILHVLQSLNIDCDYMVGAQLEGFDVMVKLSHDAPYVVFEGDEYLTSPIDRRPKFHLYKPHIAVISGIAWDHVNVFPTFENYVKQFEIFIQQIHEDGSLIYFEEDQALADLAVRAATPKNIYPYAYPIHHISNNITFVKSQGKNIPLSIFGKHNLANLNAALLVCRELGVDEETFYKAIQSFKGASKRLELVKSTARGFFYKDFAHAPSKLKATIEALKNQYPEHELVACIELHTFSSLNATFLPLYKDTMTQADTACVYYNPDTLAHKKLPPLTPEKVKSYFGRKDLKVFNCSEKMKSFIIKKSAAKNNKLNVLMMSSGDFDGLNFSTVADDIFTK